MTPVILTVFDESKARRVRNDNEDSAAAHTQPGAPDPTTRCRSSGLKTYADDAVYVPGWSFCCKPRHHVAEIKRQIRLAWPCYDRFKREPYDMEDAPFTLVVRLLTTEVMETLCDLDCRPRALR